MKNKIAFYILAISLSSAAYTQNQSRMSQSMLYQPFINSAAIGSYDNLNGALFYRTQWVGFEGAPQQGGFSVNSPIGKSNNFVGLTFYNDQLGVNSTYDLSATYSYRLKLNPKNYLSFGLSPTLIMAQSKLGDVDVIQPGDPIYAANTKTVAMPNVKFGAYYYTNRFYAGLAVPNILKNQIESTSGSKGITTFDFSNMHIYLHTGYQFPISQNWDGNTSLLVKHVSGAPVQMGLNGQVVYKKVLGLGFSARTSAELIFMANYRITKDIKLGYAYDLNLGQLGQFSSGSHEMILVFDIINRNEKPIIECPRF